MRERLVEQVAAMGLPGWVVPNYWFMLTAAIIAGSLVTVYIGRRQREEAPVSDLLFIGIVGLFIGSKLVYEFEHGHGWDHVLQPAGFSLYGGLIGLVSAWLLYYAIRPYSLLSFLDCVTPGLALGLFLGRIGCFMAGCNGGIASGLPWGVQFPPGTSSYSQQGSSQLIAAGEPLSLPAHPTQLYESLFGLTAFFLLLHLLRRKSWNGEIFFTGMIWYAAFRFPVEWIRADATGFRPLGIFSSAQFLSLILLLGSSAALFLLSKRNRSTAIALAGKNP